MTGYSEPHPTAEDYRQQARVLLTRLPHSTRRDRIAFAYGYVLAFDAMAGALQARYLKHHLSLATALHNLCTQELR